MFLAGIEGRQRELQAKYGEIRRILAEARLPGTKEYGLSLALKLPREVHDRLEEVRSRHGLRSLKEAAYKALMLGLSTMERLPAGYETPEPRTGVYGRVLTQEEISRLKDEGFDCPRERPQPRPWGDDEDLAAAG